jgi:hypothetical protein
LGVGMKITIDLEKIKERMTDLGYKPDPWCTDWTDLLLDALESEYEIESKLSDMFNKGGL